MLTVRNSNVDVLVIGAGPTGLGAAKRLNHFVSIPRRRRLPRHRGIQLMLAAERPLLADCRLQPHSWRSRLDRCHPRGLRESPSHAIGPAAVLTRAPHSCTMSVATLSSPTTSTSMTASTRLSPRSPTGTPTSVSPTSAARASGSRTRSRTTFPCFPRRSRSSAWTA